MTSLTLGHANPCLSLINYESQDDFCEYFQNAINQNPTAIIIGITQAFDSYQDLVTTARDAGIDVYSNDNSLVDGVISSSTLDNTQAAIDLMDQVAADHPGTLTSSGIVTTVDNVPAVGATFSSVFDYYGGSADDDAWYNWNDGPGIYIVTDAE